MGFIPAESLGDFQKSSSPAQQLRKKCTQRLQQIPIISLHLSTIQGASKNAGKLRSLLKENCKRIADSGHSIAGLDYNGSKSPSDSILFTFSPFIHVDLALEWPLEQQKV